MIDRRQRRTASRYSRRQLEVKRHAESVAAALRSHIELHFDIAGGIANQIAVNRRGYGKRRRTVCRNAYACSAGGGANAIHFEITVVSDRQVVGSALAGNVLDRHGLALRGRDP